jgi:uroporphyrinogen-III synthase
LTQAPLPLAGVGVVITRAEVMPGPLERRLRARGAHVLHWTAVVIAPPADPRPLAKALAHLDRYDWIVFSSAHTVEAVTSRVSAPPQGLKVAAVGSATADELERAGWPVDRLPAHFGAEGLLEALAAAGDLAGRHVLFPASDLARAHLPSGLAVLGAIVDRVEAYRTLPAPLDPDACREAIAHGKVDAVTFTSPSAVVAMAAVLGGDQGPGGLAPTLSSVAAVSIGPTTSTALVEHGLTVAAEAMPSTLDGLVDAVERAVTARLTPSANHTTATPTPDASVARG